MPNRLRAPALVNRAHSWWEPRLSRFGNQRSANDWSLKKSRRFGLLAFSAMVRFLGAERSRALSVPMQTNTEIGYNSKIEGDVIVTRRDAALNWFRKVPKG